MKRGANFGEGYPVSMRPWRLLLRIRDALLERRLLHTRRGFRIGGQGPKLRWKKNRGGLKRTIEEAVAIARRNGVEVPEDVAFFEAEPGELKGSLRGLFAGQRFETARGPDLQPRDDGRIYLQDHYNKNGRIPFRVHPDIADRQRIAKSRGSDDRHHLTTLNVRGNRQQPRGQVSVKRSTTCRSIASGFAR
jgi:hypothetical protein